jgi:hypothetical protein
MSELKYTNRSTPLVEKTIPLQKEAVEFGHEVLSYFKNKHANLLHDYTVPDGSQNESCLLIAYEIASLLLAEHKKPYIAIMRKKDGSKLNPLTYKNKNVKWSNHTVCCLGEMVLDPILEKPVLISEYTQLLFGENLEMNVLKQF